MRPADRMLSGSIGKTYVTAAAHHLVQAGKLSLDDKAAKFFADAGWFGRLPNAGEITLRHLLRHTTGIPRHVMDPRLWKTALAEKDKVWKPEELLALVFDRPALFPAGKGLNISIPTNPTIKSENPTQIPAPSVRNSTPNTKRDIVVMLASIIPLPPPFRWRCRF